MSNRSTTGAGRAAVQLPAPRLMLDDGEVERRVRLIRPMEHPAVPLAMVPQTHWREAGRESFARAWAAELADVPEFTDSEIHIAAGLEAFSEQVEPGLSAPDRYRRANRDVSIWSDIHRGFIEKPSHALTPIIQHRGPFVVANTGG